MEKIILIDGNSLINRAFFATPLFTTSAGLPTNAVMGFIKLLLKIINDVKPKYAVVAFDMHAPTFRHKMYADYKGTRKGMPEELVVQMPVIKECLALMNIKTIEKEGIEADDLLGSMSRKFSKVESYIYTGDRDSYQLVKENVNVCYTLRGVSDILLLNDANFKEKIELEPLQIIDLKALMGDSSDNIPGVPGIGEKSARKLLSEYHDVENIYAHLDEMKGALRKKLEEGKQSAYLSKTLATINTTVEIDLDLEDCRVIMPFSQAVKQKFAALEFRLLYANDALFEAPSAAELVQGTDDDYHLPEKIISVTNASDILPELKKSKEVALVWNDEKHIFVNEKEYHIEGMIDLLTPGLSMEEEKAILKEIFEDSGKKVILHRSKDMRHLLNELGISFNADFEDISILRYLVDYTGKEEELDFIFDSYGYSKDYMGASLYRLYHTLYKKVQLSNMEKLYTDIEKPVSIVLYEAEKEGITVDEQLIKTFGEIYKQKMNEASAKILALADEPSLNINSSAQLGAVLFDKLGLPKGKKSKNGSYSVNVDVLETLSEEHEIARQILEYRKWQKLNSTYIEGLKACVKEGKIHTTYMQIITSTGRLSSKNPNLQNIPIRTEEGRELRKLFIAKEGHVLVDADYSQIELRLMAYLSGCKGLIEAYREGKDIHRDTAAKVNGIAPEEVTPDLRRKAKTVNFGIIYGESAYGLSQSLHIKAVEAAEFIDKYFQVYPEVKEFLNKTVDQARENGYVTTMFGRKRDFPELKSSNYAVRQFGERAAMNMPLQGSSADIIKLAMIAVQNELKKRNMQSKLVLQIHDELVLDCPVEEQTEAAELLKACMENVVQLSVPLTVEVSIGRSWYDAK